SFQADHGVAAPIGEPMVAGNHGAHFFSSRPGAKAVVDAPCGNDEKLIGSQNKFGGGAPFGFRLSAEEQTAAAALFRVCSVFRSDGFHRVPRLGGGNQSDGRICSRGDGEETGTPKIAPRGVATALFDAIDDFLESSAVHS